MPHREVHRSARPALADRADRPRTLGHVRPRRVVTVFPGLASPGTPPTAERPDGDGERPTARVGGSAAHRVRTLRGFRDAYRQLATSGTIRGLGVTPAQLWARWTAPLRAIESLRAAGLGTVAGDVASADRFRRRLDELGARVPRAAGAAGTLRARGRDRSVPPATGRAVCRGCDALLPVTGIAPLYLAAFMTRRDDDADLERAFDVIAALSLAHGHLESAVEAWTTVGPAGVRAHLAWGAASGHPLYAPAEGSASDARDRAGAARDAGGWGIPRDGGSWGGDASGPIAGGGPGGGGHGGGGHGGGPRPADPDDGGLPFEPDVDVVGYTPDPDDPDGDTGPWTEHPLRIVDAIPWPEATPGERVRAGCESLLMEMLGDGAPQHGALLRNTGWAESIDSVDLSGPCPGDTITIHGSGFGDAQPDDVELMLPTRGGCNAVEPTSWSDTAITAVLPSDVAPGPVGFFNPDGPETVNAWIAATNRQTADIMVASRCVGRPLDFPRLPTIPDHPCPPKLGVNEIVAGIAEILLFEAEGPFGTGPIIFVRPGDPFTLRWSVTQPADITLERTFGPGPPLDDSGAAILTDPEGTTLSLVAPDAPTRIRISLRATNPCTTSIPPKEVVIEVVEAPTLTITGVEVTQAIQTLDHDVPLVANKDTVVRVSIEHDLGPGREVPNVTGRLRVVGDSVPVHHLLTWHHPINESTARPPQGSPGASITVADEPDRTDVDGTLNFRIPPVLAEGEIELELEVSYSDFGSANTDASVGISGSVEGDAGPFMFRPRRPVHIKYIPVTVIPADGDGPAGPITNWTLGTDPTDGVGTVSNPPSDAECEAMLRWAMHQIPTTATFERHPTMSISMQGGTTTISTPFGDFPRPIGLDVWGNVMLEWIRVIRMCGMLDFTGLVCPDDDDSIWVILVPATTGWGRAHIGGLQMLTRWNRTTAAHEFGHIFGQRHLAVTCADGDVAPGGDPPEDFPDGGDVLDVPFDIWTNATITTGADEGVLDLMTYCDTRWVSPERWQRMFDFIGS